MLLLSMSSFPIERSVLERLLQENPKVTQRQLAGQLGCSRYAVGQALKFYGLRTRKKGHFLSSETKARISATRRERGVASGPRNPNAGDKDRPWLEGDRNPLRRWHMDNPDFGERQRGEANPIHKVRHLYEDPEYVKQITRGIRAHVDQKRGSTYEEVYGEVKAAEYRQKLREASPGRLAKYQRQETEPERILREILEEMRVSFQQEKPIGHYVVDFLLPDHKVVLQADGDYWHGHPDIYRDADLKVPEA